MGKGTSKHRQHEINPASIFAAIKFCNQIDAKSVNTLRDMIFGVVGGILASFAGAAFSFPFP